MIKYSLDKLNDVKANINSPVFTGQVFIPEGTNIAPGLVFQNDSSNDTGFYHIAEGNIGIACNGKHIVTINSNSVVYDTGVNLLVGTTTDNGVDKLQVNGSISASNLFTPIISTLSDADCSSKQFISPALSGGTYIANVRGFDIYNVAYEQVFSFVFAVHFDASSSEDIQIVGVNKSTYKTENNEPSYTFYFGNQKRLSVQSSSSDKVSCTCTVQKIL
jgi:hypothetical protein